MMSNGELVMFTIVSWFMNKPEERLPDTTAVALELVWNV